MPALGTLSLNSLYPQLVWGWRWQRVPSVLRGSLQKPEGAQDRKCLQKVGLFGDITLYKQLGTNSTGRNGFLCFQRLSVKRGG